MCNAKCEKFGWGTGDAACIVETVVGGRNPATAPIGCGFPLR